MDINNPHNQSYHWFILREDQSNVLLSSNNFTIQNPQISGQETRFIVDTGSCDSRQYVQINDTAAVSVHENVLETENKHVQKPTKDEDPFWDRNRIKLLLTCCLEDKYKNANKEIYSWTEIAALVGSAPEECNKKYKNLRRTYVRLFKKKRLGKDVKWVHYNTCEEVFKDCKLLSPSILEPWEDNKVRTLLSLYIENLHRFRSSNCLQKDIWKEIATVLGTTEYNCYHKFKNLKRTYFNWLERSCNNKLIKWPYHHYFERIFYNYDPTVGPWDRNKTKQLLDAYIRIAEKFRNPRFQKKELWKEISSVVGESPNNCDKKFRNLKQTYIKLKMRADSGRPITKWRYYKDFEVIYNNSVTYTNDGTPKLSYKCQEEDYIKHLLSFYIENKEKFKDPLTKKRKLWKMVGPKLGLTSEECDRKFRNLKQTYIRLSEKKRETGKCNKWPYYSYFEKIYDEQQDIHRECNHSSGMDCVTMSQIRRVVQDVNERKDNDRKFEKLIQVIQESNDIQRERNKILQALLNRKC